jgi:hypothetical protein
MRSVVFTIVYLALALAWCMLVGAVAIAGCAVMVEIAGWQALPAVGVVGLLAWIVTFEAMETIVEFMEG